MIKAKVRVIFFMKRTIRIRYFAIALLVFPLVVPAQETGATKPEGNPAKKSSVIRQKAKICYFVVSRESGVISGIPSGYRGLEEKLNASDSAIVIHAEASGDYDLFSIAQKSAEKKCDYILILQNAPKTPEERVFFRILRAHDGNRLAERMETGNAWKSPPLDAFYSQTVETLERETAFTRRKSLLKEDARVPPNPDWPSWQVGYSVQYYHPVGDLELIFHPGVMQRLHFQGSFLLLPIWETRRLTTFLDAGFFIRNQKTSDVDYRLILIPSRFGFGYRFFPFPGWQIIPQIYTGLQVSLMQGIKNSHSETVLLGAQTQVHYRIHPGMAVSLDMGYEMDNNIYVNNRSFFAGLTVHYLFSSF